MIPLFLHGGGAEPEADRRTFGEFIVATRADRDGKLGLVILAGDQEYLGEYRRIFERAGASAGSLVGLPVSPENPPGAEMLNAHDLSGVFVCGGATPLYQEALCGDRSWLQYLRERNIPYGGTSAGAAIAAEEAIVGGWQVRREGTARQMLYQGAGEDLDLLEVRSGLGLAPFAVEVHAGQWGTLTRLLHAVESGLVQSGWAIDENTLLRIDEQEIAVFGSGHTYHVRKAGATEVTIYTDGAKIRHNHHMGDPR